jgi:1,2-diacylglycerol 3-beta-glucosyltransferase
VSLLAVWLAVGLALAALPCLLPALYLFGLALLARRARPQMVDGFVPDLRVQILVPAHNEAAGIARTVKNLAALRYPAELRRLLVIADNCTDETAALARQAGAAVLERHDVANRGKGHALAAGYGHCIGEGWCDAVVVVDADTMASENLLEECAVRFRAGDRALQADYGVLNANESWRTRLLSVAFTLFHEVRSSARERLRLSCGLRGNGMGFRVEVLKAVPHRAFSVVEDLEYGLDLGEAGIRVAYVGSASVRGEMAPSERTSRSQRHRWEGGRRGLVRQRLGKLLKDAIRRRSALLLDLAIDLWIPPLSTVVLEAVVGTAVSVAVVALGWCAAWVLLPWLVVDCLLLGYVLRGWALSGVGIRGLLDLCWAPVYILWKLTLRLGRSGRPPGEWVRTEREGNSRADP